MRKIITLIASCYLVSKTLASHYRGGTYQFYPTVNGKTTISTTQTWRNTAAGYTPECTKEHVTNQTPSLTTITAFCSLHSGGICGSWFGSNLNYIVSFADKTNEYCYGSGDEVIDTPTGSYSYGWSSCCWVPLTDDEGLGSPNMFRCSMCLNVYGVRRLTKF